MVLVQLGVLLPPLWLMALASLSAVTLNAILNYIYTLNKQQRRLVWEALFWKSREESRPLSTTAAAAAGSPPSMAGSTRAGSPLRQRGSSLVATPTPTSATPLLGGTPGGTSTVLPAVLQQGTHRMAVGGTAVDQTPSFPSSPILPTTSGLQVGGGSFFGVSPNTAGSTATMPLSSAGSVPQALSGAGESLQEVLEPVKAAAKKQATGINSKAALHTLVFTPCTVFTGIAAFKSLLLLCYWNYKYNLAGGWDRFLVLSALGYGYGQLVPFAQHVAGYLLPSLKPSKLGEKIMAEEGLSWASLDALVDVLLGGLSNVGGVFFQNIVFVQIGCGVLPAFVTHCVPGMICYFWMFLFVAFVGSKTKRIILSRFRIDTNERGARGTFFVWLFLRAGFWFLIITSLQTSFIFGALLYKKQRYGEILRHEDQLRSTARFMAHVDHSDYWKGMLVSLMLF